LLFMVVAKHTAESCPGGVVRPDKELMNKLEAAMNSPGVKLIEGYLDGPNHVFYLVVEANDNTALNNAVEPLRIIGGANITPVLKFSDARAWTRKIGVQK